MTLLTAPYYGRAGNPPTQGGYRSYYGFWIGGFCAVPFSAPEPENNEISGGGLLHVAIRRKREKEALDALLAKIKEDKKALARKRTKRARILRERSEAEEAHRLSLLEDIQREIDEQQALIASEKRRVKEIEKMILRLIDDEEVMFILLHAMPFMA